jgi:hypothetical protein
MNTSDDLNSDPFDSFIHGLSDRDKDLLKFITMDNRKVLLDMEPLEFDEYIRHNLHSNNRSLSKEDLNRRTALIRELKRCRTRAILKRYSTDCDRRVEQLENILAQISLLHLDEFARSDLIHCTTIGVISYQGPILALADSEKKSILIAQVQERKVDDHMTEQCVKFQDIVFNCCPIKVVTNDNPLTKQLNYHLTFISNSFEGELEIGPSSIDGILTELRKRSLIVCKRRAEDIFNVILGAFEQCGKTIHTAEIEKPGFYLIQNKIQCNKRNFKMPNKGDAVKTCYLLDLLAKQWRSGIFATQLKWIILSPFGYVLKQNNVENPSNKWIPHAFNFGERDVGKDTIALICEKIWELPYEKFVLPAAGANTDARFGEAAATWTFPIFVNEVEKLFEKDPQILSIVKSSAQSLTCRTVYTRMREQIIVPALASFMFASNPEPPSGDDGTNKRFICTRFTKKDTKSINQQKKFEQEIISMLVQLSVLGHFVACYVMKNNQILFAAEPWHNTATKILKEFYFYAEVELPDWIDKFVIEDRYKENSEGKVAAVRSFMLDTINKSISMMARSKAEMDMKGKIQYCYSNNLISWLAYDQVKDNVIIRREIISDMNSRFSIGSLQILAEILNWRFQKQYWLKRSAKNISCVHVTFADFLEFVTSDAGTKEKESGLEESPVNEPKVEEL